DNACIARVCAQLPACCATAWTHSCVIQSGLQCTDPCPGGEAIVNAQLASYASTHPFAGGQAFNYTVTPILFVPADFRSNPDVPFIQKCFDQITREIQGYYGFAVGKPFFLAPLRRVNGDLTAANYWAINHFDVWFEIASKSGRTDS